MRRKISLLLVFLALVCSSVFAFQFEPLVQTFDVSGPNATKTFTITNDSDDIIAVVVSALVRTQDAQGNEVNSDASRYFNIQPARILIQPHPLLGLPLFFPHHRLKTQCVKGKKLGGPFCV